MKRSNGGRYGICFDCDPNSSSFQTIDALDRTDNGQNPPILLFSQTFDDFGIHQVILINQNDTRTVPSGNSQITIDRFELQLQDPSSPTTSTTPTSTTPSAPTSTTSSNRSSSSSATSGSSTSTAHSFSSSAGSSSTSPSVSSNSQISSSPSLSSSQASSSSPAPESPSKDSVPIGPIIGGVIGGVALLLLWILLVILCLRYRKRKAVRQYRPTSNDGRLLLSPYGMPTANSGSPSATDDSGYQPMISDKQMRELRRAGGSQLQFNPTSATHSVPSGSGSESVYGQSRREVDGGPMSVTDAESSIVLPPDYNQIFPNGRQ
ncbi:hypothetical protein VKT23_006619 [Stygiomarasmius scandens]|uniref:Mid2 domain-containing protein n=1 Tax=Marasmiellus scandens TaxID=2682957 RepID=A0ABR1JNY4_9AGAR